MVYGKNEAYSWAYSINPFFKIPNPFSKIKLDYSLKSDLSIMNPDQRYRYLKYSLKQGISSIFGVSLLSFGTVLFAQDIAPGAASTPQAGQRENQNCLSQRQLQHLYQLRQLPQKQLVNLILVMALNTVCLPPSGQD